MFALTPLALATLAAASSSSTPGAREIVNFVSSRVCTAFAATSLASTFPKSALAVLAPLALLTLPCTAFVLRAGTFALWQCSRLLTLRCSRRQDFAWRFKLDVAPPPPPPPPPPPAPGPPKPVPPGELPKRLAACKDGCKQGVNYGTGSIKELHTGTYQDCCTACAHNGDCLAWDWNSAGGTCYLKDNAKGTEKMQRWSGKMPKKLEDSALAVPASPAPPHGPPAGHPPQSLTKYDDSTWQLVDAPHDMLINQEFVRAAAALFLASSPV